ncbi:hypothetical protein, partial [Cytobacillus oceanisediminis]
NNSTAYRVNFNSGKQSINKNKENFFKSISSLITRNKQNEDKVLIVCLKSHIYELQTALEREGMLSIGLGDDYKNEKVAINWFGNLIGKNNYKDFSQCWIIGTPNIPIEAHLINYLQNSISGAKIEGPVHIKKGRFKEDKYKLLQVSHLACEIYQSIKRIQRNIMPNAKYYIVNSDEEVFQLATNKMKNLKIGKIVELGIQKDDKRKKTKENKVLNLVNYIKNLTPGVYPKKQVREVLNLSSNNFSRYLNPEIIEIKELIDSGKLIIEKQKLIIK